jgi:hypothetical protein
MKTHSMLYLVKDNDGDEWQIIIEFQIEEYPNDPTPYLAVEPVVSYQVAGVPITYGQVPMVITDWADTILEDGQTYLDVVESYVELLTIPPSSDIVSTQPTEREHMDLTDKEPFFETLNQMVIDAITEEAKDELFDQYVQSHDSDIETEYGILDHTSDSVTKGQFNRYYGLIDGDEFYFMEGTNE